MSKTTSETDQFYLNLVERIERIIKQGTFNEFLYDYELSQLANHAEAEPCFIEPLMQIAKFLTKTTGERPDIALRQAVYVLAPALSFSSVARTRECKEIKTRVLAVIEKSWKSKELMTFAKEEWAKRRAKPETKHTPSKALLRSAAQLSLLARKAKAMQAVVYRGHD